jgi:aspartate kinase
MKTVVLKFGGTSVGSIDRIKKVCKIISSYKKKNNKVMVISSAMSGVTNDLVNKSRLICNNFDKAEYDTLLSTGEQASCALIFQRLEHKMLVHQ